MRRVGTASPRPGRGKVADAVLGAGAAGRAYRTTRTLRGAGRADRRPEVHQPLDVGRVVAHRDERLRERPELLLDRALARKPGDQEVAREDALDVAVEDRRARAEREAGDRRRRRSPDAGQARDVGERFRKLAGMSLDDELRGAVEVAGTRVIAEPAPQAQDLVLARRGEAGDVGKAGAEALVVRDDRRNLRLLQHDLGEPDRVRIARALPGQVVAPVAALPADDHRREAPVHFFRPNRPRSASSTPLPPCCPALPPPSRRSSSFESASFAASAASAVTSTL